MTKKQADRFKIKLIKKSMTIKTFCENNGFEYSLFVQRLNSLKPMNGETESAIRDFIKS